MSFMMENENVKVVQITEGTTHRVKVFDRIDKEKFTILMCQQIKSDEDRDITVIACLYHPGDTDAKVGEEGNAVFRGGAWLFERDDPKVYVYGER